MKRVCDRQNNTYQHVGLVWTRYGPYHIARLRAAAQRFQGQITAIEVCPNDRTYNWDPLNEDDASLLVPVVSEESSCRIGAKKLVKAFVSIFENYRINVVAIPGWGTPHSIAAIQSAIATGTRVILMSESTAWDQPRRTVVELVKSRIISVCSAALVGGTPHLEYLMDLGLPQERIVIGYDVVDNKHFWYGARKAVSARDQMRSKLGAPEQFFLACARFIPKKNLFGLMHAYALYRKRAGDQAWSLVILGDGELRPQLEEERGRLGLNQWVLMPGFKQYEELPAWYGLASGFVHASTVEQWGLVVNEAMATGLPVLVSKRCGCARDLVREGVNGFTFDPFDVEELSRRMYDLAHGDVDRASMGRASREIIAHWGPERFAQGLEAAVEIALSFPRPRAGWPLRVLLASLVNIQA